MSKTIKGCLSPTLGMCVRSCVYGCVCFGIRMCVCVCVCLLIFCYLSFYLYLLCFNNHISNKRNVVDNCLLNFVSPISTHVKDYSLDGYHMTDHVIKYSQFSITGRIRDCPLPSIREDVDHG